MKYLLAAAMFATLAPLADAQAHDRRHSHGHGWQILGSRWVSHFHDRDVIRVGRHAKIRKIKICVERAPVRFYDVDVKFRNGRWQDIRTPRRLRAGRCTGPLDLRGDWRRIRKIVLDYKVARGYRRGRVVILGR